MRAFWHPVSGWLSISSLPVCLFDDHPNRKEAIMSSRVWPHRLRTGAYWFVAAEFLVGAVTKFWPGPTFFGPPYSVKFAEWGFPPEFRFLVGALELLSAVMLVVPRRRFRFIASTILVLVLTGAVTTHIVNHDVLSESISAPIHLIIAAIMALANWPANWRELLRPWNGAAPERIHGELQRA